MSDRSDVSRPLVSVVIPTFNHAHFLPDSVGSVLSQSFQEFEILVVNNFSQDNTEEVIQGFGDPRIQLINFRNGGVIAASRNEGIRRSRGEWVAFLDSDDKWYPEKLRKCMQAVSSGDVDIVCHGLRYVKNGQKLKDYYFGPARQAEFKRLLFDGNCLAPSATVVRKSHLLRAGGFPTQQEYITAEDYHLWLTLSKTGSRFHFVREILGEYRIHEQNSSGAPLRHLNATLAVVSSHYGRDDTTRHGVADRLRLRKRNALTYYAAARAFGTGRNLKEAMRFFAKAALCYPFIPRVYIAAVWTLGHIARGKR